MAFRALLAILLLAFTCAAATLKPAASAQRKGASWQQLLFRTERLKLMTWNVGRARMNDEQTARTDDLPHVIAVIERERPDVVALHELSAGPQLGLLARRLRAAYFGMVSGRRSLSLLLVRRRHKLINGFEIRTRVGRRAPALVFERARVKDPITVVGLHADPFDAARRRRYLEDLVAATRGRRGYVFLLGDFNLDVAGDARQTADTASLSDRLVHDAESYTLLGQHFADLGKLAGATALLGRRLDYIFARPRTVMVGKALTLKEAIGDMDHQPLVVHADLRAQARVSLQRE